MGTCDGLKGNYLHRAANEISDLKSDHYLTGSNDGGMLTVSRRAEMMGVIYLD